MQLLWANVCCIDTHGSNGLENNSRKFQGVQFSRLIDMPQKLNPRNSTSVHANTMA